MSIAWGCPIVDDAGRFIRCVSASSDPRVVFSGETMQTVSIPEPGRDIRACWAHGHAYAVVKGQNTGAAYVCRDDGLVANLGPTAGNQCVGIQATTDGVLAVYVTTGGQYVRWWMSAELASIAVATEAQPAALAPGTSQGFLDLTPDGTPVWTDLNRALTLDGVPALMCMSRQRNSITVGQRAADPPQVILYDETTKLHTVWQGATSFPPQLAVAPDGRAMVGIAADGAAVFVSSPFGAYVPAPGPPPPQPPPPGNPTGPPSSPIVTIPGYRPEQQASYGKPGLGGPFFALDPRNGNFPAPGNTQIVANGGVLGGGNDLMGVPVFVDLQSSGNPPEKIRGFYGGANADTMGNAGLTGAAAWHKARYPKSDILRYYDGPETPQAFIDQCEREAIVLVQCYPRPSETVSASMGRFRMSVDRVVATGRRVGIVRALNSKFGGDGTFAEQVSRVLAIQDPLCALVRGTPSCIADFWFSYGRWANINGKIIDCGAAYCAEFQAWTKILGGLFTGLP